MAVDNYDIIDDLVRIWKKPTKPGWTDLIEKRLDDYRATSQRVLYMHTPVCESQCTYCPFYRDNPKRELDNFVESTEELIYSMSQRKFIQASGFDIYYFGGGSPTVLGPKRLDSLLQKMMHNMGPNPDYEFTLESTIRHINDDMIDVYKRNGVTRISLGVQSFNTDARRRLGRKIDRKGVIKGIENLMDAGLPVSVDLMYGLPGQSPDDLVEDIKTVTSIGVDNISQYGVIPYDDAPLFKMIQEGRSPDTADKKLMEVFMKKGEATAIDAGYHRWNKRNFSKVKGDICEYTASVKEGRDIIPLGSAAMGEIANYQFMLDEDLLKYIEKAADGILPVTKGQIKDLGKSKKVMKDGSKPKLIPLRIDV